MALPYDDPRMTPDDPSNGGSGTNAPTVPYTQDDLNNARQFYADFIQQHGLSSWGDPSDAVRFYQSARQQGQTHDAALQSSLSSLGWNDASKWPASTTGTTQTTGTKSAPNSLATLPSPFTSTFTAPPQVNLGGPAGIPYIPPVPQFNAPGFQGPPAFAPPSMADVLNEPGYAFGLSQGLGAVKSDRAARGLINSGDTLRALNNYAGDYATQRYQGSFDRMLNTYLTNAQTQYFQPYEIAYRNATSSFAPNMEQWRVQGQAGQRENELDYSRAYDKWLADFDQKLRSATFLRDTAAL